LTARRYYSKRTYPQNEGPTRRDKLTFDIREQGDIRDATESSVAQCSSP